MAYSKLYSSIVHSSLWTESDHIRLLFITLLAIADREGYVYGSRNGLLRLANLDVDECDEDDPFEALMSPDKDSSDLMRNPENEGRRIERVPSGFRILNYGYYRGLRNEDDRREQNREAQRRHRSKVSQDKPPSAKISQGQTSPSASASVSASTSTREEVQGKPNLVPTAEDIYNAYPLKKERPQAIEAIRLAVKHYGAAFLLERTTAYAKARNGDMEFVPYPQKWFKREGFNDDPMTWKPKSNERQPEKERAPTGEAYRIYEPPKP